MIPTIHRGYYKPKVTIGPIRCYIRSGKPNSLPTTLPRISWNTSTILRLPRRLHHMKCHLINRINNLVRKSNNIPIHYMSKNYIKPINSVRCVGCDYSHSTQ